MTIKAALLSVLPAADIGLSGIVVVIVMMILGGLLVPRSTLNRMLAERDKLTSELQATLAREQERNCVQARQITTLLEQADTSARALESIRKTAVETPPREVT